MLTRARSIYGCWWVLCGNSALSNTYTAIQNLWLARLRKVLKSLRCAEKEKVLLVVYFQLSGFWNIIITATCIFRLFKCLTHLMKLFKNSYFFSFIFFRIGLGWREIPWCNRTSTMAKEFLPGSCTGFPQYSGNQYLYNFHTSCTKMQGQYPQYPSHEFFRETW